jgi:hypothetical protein
MSRHDKVLELREQLRQALLQREQLDELIQDLYFRIDEESEEIQKEKNTYSVV